MAIIGAVGGAAPPITIAGSLPAAYLGYTHTTAQTTAPSSPASMVHLSGLARAMTAARTQSSPAVSDLYNASGLLVRQTLHPSDGLQCNVNSYGQSYRALSHLTPEIAALLLELLLQNQTSATILALAAAVSGSISPTSVI